MQGKKAAISWSFLHSIGDTLEEKILLKYQENQYMFWQTLLTGIGVLLLSLFGKIELTFLSFIILIFYSLAMIGGDFCYVKAIQTLPIGLANLIDSGSVFIILICDICLGYIQPKITFFFLFFIFILSIYIFSLETSKMKNEIQNKKIDLKNVFILITSTIFYASEPYFIKLASSKGANEFGINLVYYMIASPIFYFLYRRQKKNIAPLNSNEKKDFFGTIILLSIIYTITGYLYMLSYIGEIPIVITLLTKLQLFFVVIISVIRKTDKMNWKKTISLLLGITSIILMTFLS